MSLALPKNSVGSTFPDDSVRVGFSFAPFVRLPDGSTVVPAGWMWVLGFALGGCEWAIRKADTEEFRETMRQWAKEQKQKRLVAAIESYERRLAELCEELRIV